jgi:4-carboxymuconolactone decarboxylase
METIEDRKQKGREVYRKMFDDKKLAGLETAIATGGFGAALANLAQEFAFGSVWARPGLERKTRSVVTITALLTLGRLDELRKHITVGLNQGLTPAELEEIFIQAVPYAGFPAATQAMEVARAVLAERGLV